MTSTAIECEGCAKNSGLYLLTCTACCLRLIRSAPEHLRKGMAFHVKRSVSAAQWEEIKREGGKD
jgi:hypothetical protein